MKSNSTEPQYMKREIRQSDTNLRNTCNCWRMAPFRYADGVLYVSKREHERLVGTITMDRLQQDFDQIRISSDLDQFPLLTPDDPVYQKVYGANLLMTNAESWYRLLPNSRFLRLTDQEADDLLDHPLDSVATKCVTTRLAEVMNEIPADRYFVKTGTCSTKHNLPPRPVVDAEDALSHLLSSDNVRHSLRSRRARGILVQPWKTCINPNAEFRVFVKRGIVTGVSQQYLYEVWPMMHYWDARDIIRAFQKLFDSFDTAKTTSPFRDSCFDGYVTTDPDGEVRAHLIELNSGAFGWGPAGSALFEWETDPPPEPESGVREFVVTI